MASVFLSYDHEDAKRAAPVATALEEAGHSVWWDRHIHGGAEYSSEIESAVERADVVVVLWTERSVRSAWVRDEAAEGRDRGKLIPATLDGVKPPMGFRQYQTINLGTRKGRAPEHFDELLEAIDDLSSTNERANSPPSRVTSKERHVGRSRWWLISAASLVLLVSIGLAVWRLTSGSSSVPIVAVRPAEHSPGADAMARDLLVKLGSLRLAHGDTMKLVGPETSDAEGADFVFEVTRSDHSSGQGINLVLLEGKGHSLLWSRDFGPRTDGQTAIEQQAAYTAGQVLGCALEARSAARSRLDEQTVKLYLNGCALFGERYRTELETVAPIFSQIVARAPAFEAAWAKLLLAEAQTTRVEMLFNHRWVPGALPDHIRAVEKLNPRLPELYIARSALLPIAAFRQRQQLIDEASRFSPDDPDLLVFRSEFLEWGGRIDEAVNDSARAAEIDPLSAGFRSNYIQTLAYAGRIDAAWDELARAEQLWPGAPTIEDARFRLYSRYGDPREALRMARSKGVYHLTMSPDIEAFLIARIDPTPANVQRAIIATHAAELPETRKMSELAQVLGQFGREEELYATLLRWPLLNRAGEISSVLFRPALKKFRQNPRFMIIAKKLGLIDYWQATRKWADFCGEPDLPYNCKKEAAKLG